MIRRAEPKDMGKVVELLKEQNIPPDFENTLSNAIYEIDGRVIGFASLKINVEAVIALDKNASHRERYSALTELLKAGYKATAENNFDMVHVFVLDPSFSNVLKEHFDFKSCNGVYLYKKV